MRRKLKLAFIANDYSRKISYNKRKEGLLKKVNELSTLCGVLACGIIYGGSKSKPELWPPSTILVHQVISKFLEMPMMEQIKKMVSNESFLQDRVVRADEQVQKLKKDNREMEITCLMVRGFKGMLGLGWLQALGMLDLTDLEYVIDQMLKKIDYIAEENPKNMGNSDEGPEAIANQGDVVKIGTLDESIRSQGWLMGFTDPHESTMFTLVDGINPNDVLPSNIFLP